MQMDGRLPTDFLTWRSICGSTIADFLDRAEGSTAHTDPSGDHKSEDGQGSQEITNDRISQQFQTGNNDKRYDKSIALQMWPSECYISPNCGPQITPSMKIKDVRKQDKWEITNQPGSPFWNDIHINNEWIAFMTPSNNIIEEEMEVGQHEWQVKVIIRPTGDKEMSKHHLRTALANDSFEELGKGKMT